MFDGDVSVQVVRPIVYLWAIRTRVAVLANTMHTPYVSVQVTGEREHFTTQRTRKTGLAERINIYMRYIDI